MVDQRHTHLSLDSEALSQVALLQRLAAVEDRLSMAKAKAQEPNSARIANPGPLGLFAFAYTTSLLSIDYMKWAEGGTVQWSAAYGLFYGGLCQILVGMWSIWARNTFGGTTFTSFGAFWMSFGIHEILKAGGVLSNEEVQGEQTVLALWAVISFCLLLQTANINIVLMALFFVLTIGLALLAAGPNHPQAVKAGAYFVFASAVLSLYSGLAELTNEVYRKPLLPLGILNLATALPDFSAPRPDTL